MALLSDLLGERLSSLAQETNLEQGEIFVFHAGTEYAQFRCNFCWQAPGTGTAVVEAWGAGGSGSKMCCCGGGIPGNAGAYSKITVPVVSGSYVCGNTGVSCGNASQLCFRGCSQSTCIQICSSSGCNCLCAQGGYGGLTFCHTSSSSIACCLMANYNLDGTSAGGSGCFTVCNRPCMGRAYGGDINCCGGVSCTTFRHCQSCCNQSHQDHIAVPPGIISEVGTMLTYNRETDGDTQQGTTGTGLHQLYNAIGIAGRQPTVGGYRYACFGSLRACGCYEAWGCTPMVPYGVGGPGSTACSSVRDHGLRGGLGAVRIKFIGS